MSVRVFLSLSEEEFARFESARRELGMGKSQYLKYLMSGQKEIRPEPIRNRKLADKLSATSDYLKIIALKDSLTDDEKLYLMELIKSLSSLGGDL